MGLVICARSAIRPRLLGLAVRLLRASNLHHRLIKEVDVVIKVVPVPLRLRWEVIASLRDLVLLLFFDCKRRLLEVHHLGVKLARDFMLRIFLFSFGMFEPE